MDPEVSRKTMALLAVAGGGLLIIGSFMPWLKASAAFVGSLSVNGLDGGGDGIYLLIIGAFMLALGTAMLIGWTVKPLTAGWLMTSATIISIFIVIVDYGDVSERASQASSDVALASVGPGLIICALGSVALFVGALVAFKTHRESTTNVPPAPATR